MDRPRLTEDEFLVLVMRAAVAVVLILVGINAIWFPDHEPVQGLFWGTISVLGGGLWFTALGIELKRGVYA